MTKRNIKFLISAFVFALICVFVLVGCSDENKTLNNIRFDIDPHNQELQIEENDIRTNTTKLFIFSDKLENDEEILLYLYDADYTETYISFAVLNSENKMVEFSNMTSACKYKIGTESRNINRAITLTITDKGKNS